MILKSFSNFLVFLIFFVLTLTLKAEEKIDIWNNKITQENKIRSSETQEDKNKKISTSAEKIETVQKITIENDLDSTLNETKVYGIYDPEDYNFSLNMWTSTKAEEVRSSFKRIKKINLSKTSNEILESVLFSFAYPPQGMSDKEFISLKVDWLIKNNRIDLIESFLKQNKEFFGKERLVQFIVDENISKANLKNGCNQIKFIDTSIKDAYLEKFKIYCLVFNDNNSQAQLLLDLLREQKQSDKFFDDKINYLLGISEKTSSKINEKNLLNFYLSSVTIKNFKYEPSKNTKKEIWEYLNAANLITLEDVSDKQKIKELETAANMGQIDEKIIFNIYKQVPFNLNNLINANNLYQSLDEIEARSLIYQKYLLSEDINAKVKYLFLLEDLFEEKKLINIYSSFLSEELEEIGLENIPKEFKELATIRIKRNKEKKLGKIKYNDKILHQSKIIKFYLENEDKKKIQKEIDKIFKKVIKNKKYFFSAKDLALADSLSKDGFNLPANFKRNEIASKYNVPKNLTKLIENEENAFLALKIVEIIGEDEPYQLDPETIFFITNLLNKMNLIQLRNKVLISALPLRV